MPRCASNARCSIASGIGDEQRLRHHRRQVRGANDSRLSSHCHSRRKNAAVERAIAQQVAEQFEFVAWWDRHIGVNHGAGRGNKKRADRGAFSAEAAEQATGISHQQVSKWRKRQKDAGGYIAQLVAVALQPSGTDPRPGEQKGER